jgi:hypothetical protein
MSISSVHSKGANGPITIPAIGLDLFVRMAPTARGGVFSIIETMNDPAEGPIPSDLERRGLQILARVASQTCVNTP